MMKKKALSALSAASLLITTATAQSALVLQINPTDQTMALFGSATGTPVDGGGFNSITFSYTGFTDTAGTNSAMYSVQPSDNFHTLSRADARPTLTLTSQSNLFQFSFLLASTDPLTFSGTGVFLDYGTALAGFAPPGEQTAAERIGLMPNGSLLELGDGSGFGNITVQIIPEPSTVFLFSLGSLVILRRCRSVT